MEDLGAVLGQESADADFSICGWLGSPPPTRPCCADSFTPLAVNYLAALSKGRGAFLPL